MRFSMRFISFIQSNRDLFGLIRKNLECLVCCALQTLKKNERHSITYERLNLLLRTSAHHSNGKADDAADQRLQKRPAGEKSSCRPQICSFFFAASHATARHGTTQCDLKTSCAMATSAEPWEILDVALTWSRRIVNTEHQRPTSNRFESSLSNNVGFCKMANGKTIVSE